MTEQTCVALAAGIRAEVPDPYFWKMPCITCSRKRELCSISSRHKGKKKTDP